MEKVLPFPTQKTSEKTSQKFWKKSGAEDESLQSCQELLEARKDEKLRGLEEELKHMECRYEEIVVWFSMEDCPELTAIQYERNWGKPET